MSRTFLSLRRTRGYGSWHSAPGPLRGTLDSRVLPCGLCVFLCSISATASLTSSDDADLVSETGKRGGCTVSTMDLSEARGLVLFRVIRGGIGLTQRLSATGTMRLQAIGMLTLEPERLKNQLATTREDHRRWKGSSPETLKRLAISVSKRRSFLPSSKVSA